MKRRRVVVREGMSITGAIASMKRREFLGFALGRQADGGMFEAVNVGGGMARVICTRADGTVLMPVVLSGVVENGALFLDRKGARMLSARNGL